MLKAITVQRRRSIMSRPSGSHNRFGNWELNRRSSRSQLPGSIQFHAIFVLRDGALRACRFMMRRLQARRVLAEHLVRQLTTPILS